MASVSAVPSLPRSLPDLPRTRAARTFADERHAGQQRAADGAPFILHPLEVATLLHEQGYPDYVVAAGVLHDVIEDTDTDPAELELRFGPEVAALVTSLSDDPSIHDDARRKAALRRQIEGAGAEAAAIFAADKVSKVRELRMRVRPDGPTDDDQVKLDHYRRSLLLLDRLLPCHPLVAALRRELALLDDCRPAAGRFTRGRGRSLPSQSAPLPAGG